MNDVEFYREQLETQKKIWEAQRKAFDIIFNAIQSQLERDVLIHGVGLVKVGWSDKTTQEDHEKWAEKQDEQPK